MRTPYRINHGKITIVLYNRPHSCGGKCKYCFSVPGLTKSTTSNEDTELAHNCGWDATRQISLRFEQYGLLRGIGNKCDLAVKGDSFASHDPGYMRYYIKDIYDFLNGSISESLADAASLQRFGGDRCVTFKVETRPDQIDNTACKFFSEIGITTVELGVQSLDDNVLQFNNRGHLSHDVVRATKLLREYGFEVCYQVMVGLPGSNRSIDVTMLSEKLWQESFCPDALKIYPCLLLKEKYAKQQGLLKMYRNGLWRPLDDNEYIDILMECYPNIPRYVHINRIQRVIPFEKIEAGPACEIDRNMFSSVSRCLWQRSVAQKVKDLEKDFRKYSIVHYPQGKTRHCFEAVIDGDTVLGYGRLEILKDSCLIRDVRVLGNMLPVGEDNSSFRGCQHIGIGKSIFAAMESYAKTMGSLFIRVKPSFGTVQWFENVGFHQMKQYIWEKRIKV